MNPTRLQHVGPVEARFERGMPISRRLPMEGQGASEPPALGELIKE
ncbi:hypothetical protein L6Q96_05100 [Candidatus Binatia bacterium]|nr:hypothetical protein [Candidatus Binatia bacterium]